MTDVISAPTADRARGAAENDVRPDVPFDLIELLFFAYRDFVRDPDEALAAYGFGRAHHRVLHFVDRNPGLKVADLLDILKITKQSLGRVLRELVDQGFVEQREGASDRRQRLLFITAKGDQLMRRLHKLQGARIERALEQCGPEAAEAVRRFLFAVIEESERDAVAKLARIKRRV